MGLQKPKFMHFIEIPSIVIAQNTNNETLKGVNFILPNGKITFTLSKFFNIVDIMESIGGMSSFLQASLYIVSIYWIRKQWYASLYKEVK